LSSKVDTTEVLWWWKKTGAGEALLKVWELVIVDSTAMRRKKPK
jgi:hypothetical protein